MTPRAKKTVLVALAVSVVVTVAAVYAFFDPMSCSIFPKCVCYSVTGLKCPGCGTQRALHAMLGGDIAAAWRYNAFLVVMLPAIAVLLAAESLRASRPKLYAAVNSRWVVLAVLAATLAWWVLRNVMGW